MRKNIKTKYNLTYLDNFSSVTHRLFKIDTIKDINRLYFITHENVCC